jgi:hypothetical protein
MKKLITTCAALVAVSVTGASCNRGGGGAESNANKGVAAAPSTNGATAAPGSSAQAERETEVRAFLNQIYGPYATDDIEGPDYAALLEPRLAAAIAAEETGPGADPFIDAQDWTPFRPTYENIQVKGERATATATFAQGSDRKRIDYQLVRTPAGWRVHDVQSESGGSLRERFVRTAD